MDPRVIQKHYQIAGVFYGENPSCKRVPIPDNKPAVFAKAAINLLVKKRADGFTPSRKGWILKK